MKIALISAPFRNGDTEYNIRMMTKWIAQANHAGADMAVFGESALQGFDALSWDWEKDLRTAETVNSEHCERLMKAAEKYKMTVSFGFFERDMDRIFSSQMTIGKDGSVLDVFRRVSAGWKTEKADEHYREGNGFSCFEFMGKHIAVALCGDLWYEEHVCHIAKLQPDAVIWPVYCDYDADEWNVSVKYEYAQQVKEISAPVLWVNPYCADESKMSDSQAVGGAAQFQHGQVIAEHAAGTYGMLIAEI